jgi:hypothetical protein
MSPGQDVRKMCPQCFDAVKVGKGTWFKYSWMMCAGMDAVMAKYKGSRSCASMPYKCHVAGTLVCSCSAQVWHIRVIHRAGRHTSCGNSECREGFMCAPTPAFVQFAWEHAPTSLLMSPPCRPYVRTPAAVQAPALRQSLPLWGTSWSVASRRTCPSLAKVACLLTSALSATLQDAALTGLPCREMCEAVTSRCSCSPSNETLGSLISWLSSKPGLKGTDLPVSYGRVLFKNVGVDRLVCFSPWLLQPYMC